MTMNRNSFKPQKEKGPIKTKQPEMEKVDYNFGILWKPKKEKMLKNVMDNVKYHSKINKIL